MPKAVTVVHDEVPVVVQVLQIVISANGGHNFRQYGDLTAFSYPLR